MNCLRFPLIFGCLLLLAPNLRAISLSGSNGRQVEFAGIKEATPKGLTAQVAADSGIIGVTWDKLDLAALATEHPEIHEAYVAAQAGTTTALNLGIFAPAVPEKKAEALPRYEGWIDLKKGKRDYFLQLPGGEPEGILLVAVTDHGRAAQMVVGHARGSGPFAKLQDTLKLAVLTYEFDMVSGDPTVVDPFIFAEKGSGAEVLSALEAFAVKTNKPALATLPIAIFGSERVGAAFAYHFIQWKPERILAAVLIKGAFYEAAPNPLAAKVPVLFLDGEYASSPGVWHTEATAAKLFADHPGEIANWTRAVEYRGKDSMSELGDFAGNEYLKKVIPQRKPDEAGVLAELDRSKGRVGNLKSGETREVTDAPLGPDETFIPNTEFVEIWKKLLDGTLEPR